MLHFSLKYSSIWEKEGFLVAFWYTLVTAALYVSWQIFSEQVRTMLTFLTCISTCAELHPTSPTHRCAPAPCWWRAWAARVRGCLNSGDTKSASICRSFRKPVLEQQEMGIPSGTQGWHPICPQGKSPTPKADWGEIRLVFVGTQNITPRNWTRCF